jgi:hypothetical protein
MTPDHATATFHDHPVIALCVIIAMYLLPGIVASLRRHPSSLAIFALNVLLGWTVLRWIAAFVWSLTATNRTRSA